MKSYSCGQCGHVIETDNQLTALGFRWYSNFTSKISCPNCGTYTIQQAFDDTFTGGHFLVVKPFNRIRKGQIK